MIENEAEKLLAAGVIKSAQVFRSEFNGGWLVMFGPIGVLEQAGYRPDLQRTARAGGGPKSYASLDKAVGACQRMGFGRVEVFTDTATAA